MSTPPASASSPATKQIFENLAGKIPTTPLSIFYRLGLSLVALAMVLLPLLYLGIIATTAWLVYLHATHNVGLLLRSGHTIARLMAYLGPLAAGIIVIFFMFKPLLARPGRQQKKYELDPPTEPMLMEFVHRICIMVGAPRPSRIDLDCQVNASASLDRGWLGFFSNEVALTVGLPLVVGLELRQLAGILAHEFGHFSQGAGMRLTYLIRSISFWFARVVYQRDSWDAALVEWSKRADWRIAVVLCLARLAVWISRKILWILMLAGNAISCYMLRHMEHDADSYEIKLCGSSTFKQTTLKLRHLGLAAQGAYASLQQHWSNRRLPDDLNQFIVLHQNRIPPEIWEQAEQAIGSATSGWFDTHPSDKDRIAAAVRLSQPGVYHCSEPAVTLFHNYEEISRKVTQHCYQTNMNLPIASASMIPVAEAIQESSQIEEGNKALNDLAGIDWPFCCPIPLNREDIIGRSSAILDIRLGLAKLRRQIEELKPRAENAVQQLTGAERRYAGVLGAICLLCSGFRFRPESFGLAEASLPRAFEAEKEVKAQQEIGRKELQPLENVLRDRMTLALRALWNPDFASFFAEAVTWQEEVNGLLAALDILNQYHQDLLELRRLYIQMDLLLARLREGNVPESAPSHLYRLCDKIDEILKRLQHGLKDVSYPFVHSEGAISLSVYALNRETSDNAVSRTYQQCSSHVGRLFPLYFRILGRLALLAARVEEQVKD